MQETVGLANLQTFDRAGLFGQQSNSFGLIVDIAVLIATDVLEQLRDDCLSAALGENKVLRSLEFKKNIWLIVVDPLYTTLLEVLCRDGRFSLKLVAVLLINHAVADESHLLDPVRVEVQVLVEAEVRLW